MKIKIDVFIVHILQSLKKLYRFILSIASVMATKVTGSNLSPELKIHIIFCTIEISPIMQTFGRNIVCQLIVKRRINVVYCRMFITVTQQILATHLFSKYS